MDIPEVRQKLMEANLLGCVAFIDFLVKRREEEDDVLKIGAASVNNTEKPKAELSQQEIFFLPGVSFGRLDGRKMAPEDFLENISTVLQHSTAESDVRKGLIILDKVCRDFTHEKEADWEVIISRMMSSQKNLTGDLEKSAKKSGLSPEAVKKGVLKDFIPPDGKFN